MTRDAIARNLWQAIEDYRLERGWTKSRLAEHVGLPRNTIDRIQTSLRPPQPVTVHRIADALGIDRREAEGMAGLRRPTGAVSVREAILADPLYTEQQRQTMLSLVDIFEQANRSGEGEQRAS